jgi:hypothetical protein
MFINVGVRGAAIALLLWANASTAAGQPASPWPIVELRQYKLQPGQRDVLITLFEAEFVETQEAVGMKIVGTFRDLDNPDRFVWIRAFKDMPSRAEGLNSFYSGPVWKTHGKAAAATMVDASNALLLRDARPGSGFTLDATRPPKGTTNGSSALIVANIYYFEAAVEPSFVEFFERMIQPQLKAAGIPVLASFVSETAANNFPPLPVREGDRVFVWFSRFPDQADYERRLAALTGSGGWKKVADALRAKLKSSPEVLRLQPTPRSLLRG